MQELLMKNLTLHSIFNKTCIFPLSDVVYGIYFMFLCTIFIRTCDLDRQPFDLGGVWWIKLHTSNVCTNF